MAHFYGRLYGSRGEATRCGTNASGMHCEVSSWASKMTVDLSESMSPGVDVYRVTVRGDAEKNVLITINGEEFVLFKGKVYKGEHEVLGVQL